MTKQWTKLPLVPPGETLREDFLKPLGLSVDRLALELRVYPRYHAWPPFDYRRHGASTGGVYSSHGQRNIPIAAAALHVWFDTALEAEWRSLEDVRKSFPATDMVGDLAIFNIRGNNYRLIVRMVFRYKRIYIKE